MAVSPADFELYSRVTGRAVPRTPAERMKMAPAVNSFIRNKEYERPDKTTLQKGADVVGKTALAVGALAGAYALGGGFKGPAVAEVAKAVENVTKSSATKKRLPKLLPPGVDPSPTPTGGTPQPRPPFTPSGLPSQPTVSARIVDKTDDYLARLNSPPVRPDVIAEQEINAFGVPTPEGGKTKVWDLLTEPEKQMQAQNIYGEKLTKSERVPLHKQYETVQRDQRSADYPVAGSTQEAVDQFLQSRYQQAAEETLKGIPLKYDKEGMIVRGEKGRGQLQTSSPVHPLPLNTPSDTPPVLSQTDIVPPDDLGGQRLAGGVQKANTSLLGRVGNTVLGTARGVANKLDQEPWGAQREKAIASNLAYGITARGFGIGPQGGRMAGTGFNEGATQGILSRVGNLPIIRQGLTEPLQKMSNYSVFSGADVNLPNWLGGGFSIPGIPTGGQMLTGFLANNPDAAAFANAGGVTLAEGAGLGTGLFLGGAAKDAAKAALIAERSIRPVGRAIGQAHNKVLVPAGKAIGGFHGNVLVPQGRQFHQNVLVPAGREFHQNVLVPSGNSALDGIQRNLNALKASAEQQLNIKGQLAAVSESLLPTTRASGEVIIGDNHQLNRSPDLPPGESMMTVPSRAIQQFADKDIYGAGSRTPDYFEIRTDLDVSDPVEATSGFYQETKRPSKAEKNKFRAGLRERNKDIYESAEKLPERRIGKGFDWRTGKRSAKGGSGGEAGSLSGTVNYSSTDDRPQDPIWQWVKGLTEPDVSDSKMNIEKEDAARQLGKRLAEEEQSKIFDDPWGDS